MTSNRRGSGKIGLNTQFLGIWGAKVGFVIIGQQVTFEDRRIAILRLFVVRIQATLIVRAGAAVSR